MSESSVNTSIPEDASTDSLARRPEHVRQPYGEPMCAAATLRMMLLYITKGRVKIPSVRELYKMGHKYRDQRTTRASTGLMSKDVESVARELGFVTERGGEPSIDLLRRVTGAEDTPVYCALDIGTNTHAVMVERVTDTHVYFRDPDVWVTLPTKITIKKFMEQWDAFGRDYLIVRNSKN